MTITQLGNQETIATGFTKRVVITHEDLTDTDTAQSFTLASLTEGQFVRRVAYRLITDFASANGTGLTVSVGNGSSATAYMAAKELQGTEVDYWIDETDTPPTGAADQVDETETVSATFTTSGGSSPLLSEYTAGEIEIFFHVTDIAAI